MNALAPPPTSSPLILDGACPLQGHWAVLEAQGADAAQFLHNQLSQDVLLLPVGQARLAAFCNAKGRMQASFILLKLNADRVLLVLRQDLMAATLKRLSMFVLRAKVSLRDASADWCLQGLLGDAASTPVTLAPWAVQQDQDALHIGLYPAIDGQTRTARALRMSPASQELTTAAPISLAQWEWAEVMSAAPLLPQAVFETFVPQMINYESIGGVNFKKGCYPGQEVVARSQFRGAIKRRMHVFHSSAAPTSGQEVFAPSDPEQACGTVVLAAPRPDGQGHNALVSGTLESLASGWHVGSAQGPQLTPLPLPYALLEDV
jgi:tRNA-modifying protein YgfZ